MSRQYDHYTSVVTLRDDLGVRLRDPLTRQASYFKVPYQPHTFYPCAPNDATDEWRTLDGQPLKERRHAGIAQYHQFINTVENEGRIAYGVIAPTQQFFAEEVSVDCGVSFESLRTVFLDIEVASEGGFAPPENPTQPIVAITAEVWGHHYVWGCGVYANTREDVTYVQCRDEVQLLTEFVRWWTADYPDIITGWNTHTYDIPYILNRLDLLAGDKQIKITSKALSPWRKISHRIAHVMGRDQKLHDIVGVPVLDYLELYRKFSLTQQESYRLDAIAEVELGKKKVAYDEYGSLQRLAEENYQKFVDYNVRDVELVRELNNKLHHLDLCTQIAYGARVNFQDTFKQVRLWDAMMYYSLYDRQIAIPMKRSTHKGTQYAGAYVKDPHTGKHAWVVSFDVNSLYPSIMRQWNISPDRHLSREWLESRLENIECLVGANAYPVGSHPSSEMCTPRDWLFDVAAVDVPVVAWALRELLAYLDRTDIEQTLRDLTEMPDPFPWLRVLSVCLTPNKQAFRTDVIGFLPEILGRLYEERKKAKGLETKAKKAAEKAKTPEEKHQLLQEAVQWGLQQNTRKINLNSCYGAFGNEHFRFFDVRQAEAVTMTGQMIIRYVADCVNRYLNSEFGTNTDYVLASDTDSIYVKLAPVVENMTGVEAVDYLDRYCEKDLQLVIDKAFHTIGKVFNTQENILAMKREAIAEHGVWTAKKRYLLWIHDNEGVRYDPPKLKTVGVEAVRSSTPKYARTVIKKALEYFIRGDQDAFYALLDEAEEGYMTRPFEDIASPRSCNGMKEYPLLPNGQFTSGTPIQVKGSLVYNRHLTETHLDMRYPKIRDGEKIRFCYLKPQNPLRCNVIAAPNTLPQEWKLEPFLDRQEQFEKTLLSPLEPIIKHAGWAIRPVTTLF